MKTLPLMTAAALVLAATMSSPRPADAAAGKGADKVKTARLLTLDDAQRIADAAQARAEKDGWTVVIAVVDAGGHLINLRRLDDTQAGSIDVAIRKAESSVLFKRPTKALEDIILKDGYTPVMTLKNVTAVEGGLPIVHEGQVIGAIGVSGVTAAEDGMIAAAGVAAFR
jgi:uncharacterized protein GlcG (DUF336 family)